MAIIELGVIRVVDRASKVTVYKDKEVVGEITIDINCPQTKEKIFNLIKLLEDKVK